MRHPGCNESQSRQYLGVGILRKREVSNKWNDRQFVTLCDSADEDGSIPDTPIRSLPSVTLQGAALMDEPDVTSMSMMRRQERDTNQLVVPGSISIVHKWQLLMPAPLILDN